MIRYAASLFVMPASTLRYANAKFRDAAPHARGRAVVAASFYRPRPRRPHSRNDRVKSARARADAQDMPMPMFQPRGMHPPMSNTERQRQFRERNPGYYGRLHRKRKAELEAMARATVEARVAAAVTVEASVQVTAVRREPLMLPAPVVIFEIPGVNAIPAAMPVREYAEVSTNGHE